VVRRLRELSNMEKQENQRVTKQVESHRSEISTLTKDREKLQKDVGRLETEIIELKEMVRTYRLEYVCTPCPKKGSHQTFANNFLES